jgi:hypothetical protein
MSLLSRGEITHANYVFLHSSLMLVRFADPLWHLPAAFSAECYVDLEKRLKLIL